MEDSVLADEPKLGDFSYILAETKRTILTMSVPDFYKLIGKIDSIHRSMQGYSGFFTRHTGSFWNVDQKRGRHVCRSWSI